MQLGVACVTVLRWSSQSVDAAFEYRFLNTLADAFAHFGNAAQAPSAFAGFRIYVIADNDQHDYLRKKGM